LNFEQILPFSHNGLLNKFLTPNAKSLIFKTEDNVPLGKLLEKLWKKYFFVAKDCKGGGEGVSDQGFAGGSL